MILTKNRASQALKDYRYIKERLLNINRSGIRISINGVLRCFNNKPLNLSKNKRLNNLHYSEVTLRYGDIEVVIKEHKYGFFYIDSQNIKVYSNSRLIGEFKPEDIKLVDEWL